MKKILVVLILIACSMFALSAATYDRAVGFGLGLSAGYPVAGGAFKYGIGDFRVIGLIGYSFDNNVVIEAGVQYDLSRFNVERTPFYFNIGITAAMYFRNDLDGLSINVPIGISYFLMDVPMELFFKLTPGIRIHSASLEPSLGAALGLIFYVNKQNSV